MSIRKQAAQWLAIAGCLIAALTCNAQDITVTVTSTPRVQRKRLPQVPASSGWYRWAQLPIRQLRLCTPS